MNFRAACIPSSAGASFEASRTVAGAGVGAFGALEMESWERLRPEIEMSDVAMKPDGVRFIVEESCESSAAIERSRRALAFSRFSSWGLLDLGANLTMEDSLFGELLQALVVRLA